MSDAGKLIVFQEQIVEKSTMCANCRHFDGDATRNMEAWLPMRDADIERIRQWIRVSGLQVPGMDQADIGLRVAALTRDGQTSVEEAYRQVYAGIKAAALEAVGGDEERIYECDMRYVIVKQTHKDILSGKIGRCGGGGVTANGKPVGSFVFSAFHCHKWSAATGASLAHEGARRLDPLPEELVERANDKARARAREGGEGGE